MSKRYESTKVEQTKLGDRVYKTTIYPTITKKNDDIYVMSKEGDRCDALAFKYYKNSGLWWIIAQANHIGKGTLVIESGIQLRIPLEVGEILAELEELNN